MKKNNQQNDYNSYFDNDDYQENLYYEDLYEKNEANKSATEETSNPNKIDPNRRNALIVLSLFSVVAITMWVVNFRYNLRNPFEFKGEIPLSASVNNSNSCPSGNCDTNGLTPDNLELKLIDTDGDGISDWDELFIYGTSPYLEDTDGDGLSDYDEIFVFKTNPLCPEGSDCSGSLTQDTSQNTATSGGDMDGFYNLLIGLEGSLIEGSNTGQTNETSQINQGNQSSNTESNQITPTYLRELLLESGFAKESLDQISDEDILSVYQEVLNKNNF